MSRPAATAAAVVPPEASTLSAANWAPPEKTRTDMTIGATGPMTGLASTPNDAPSSSVGSTNGSAARTPARIPRSSGIGRTLPVKVKYW